MDLARGHKERLVKIYQLLKKRKRIAETDDFENPKKTVSVNLKVDYLNLLLKFVNI